jgi:hypothetical protein
MELLKDPPPAFDGVARLFEMARHLPATHHMDLRIGLACNGALFARVVLDGYRQVNFLAEHLRDLGWREHLLGGEDEMFGCDMLFSWPGEPARVEEDPSFIRRSAVELWGEHHG